MQFKDSSYFEKLKPDKLELPFGVFYLCKKLVVGEMYEGIHFDWGMAKLLIQNLQEYYGSNVEVVYIANRINSFSIDPQNWWKVERQYNILLASAIVAYNNGDYINALLEKQFTTKSIKRFLSLNEAIKWSQSLI